jgi:hypothetical protein
MAKAPRPAFVPAGAAIISLKPRRVGRPPAGPRGERVSDYAPVMIRLPQPTKEMLQALRAVSGMPVWQLVDVAVREYVQRMPLAERKLIADVKIRRARLAAES